MSVQRANRACGTALVVLSLAAALTVLVGLAQPPQPPPQDEGALAHIFQLTIVALVPTTLSYLATADWGQLWRSARPLAFAAIITAIAFGALYYGEHLR